MVKYKDFSGEIKIDFEDNTTVKSKIKEFFGDDLHEKDVIIGIKLFMGEYHHNRGNDTQKCLIFKIINENEIRKEPGEQYVKKCRYYLNNYEEFFKFFKRLDIELSPTKKGFID